MTVRELISRLETMPPEAEVLYLEAFTGLDATVDDVSLTPSSYCDHDSPTVHLTGGST